MPPSSSPRDPARPARDTARDTTRDTTLDDAPGVRLDPVDAPDLWRLLDGIAVRAGTRAPARLRLVGAPIAEVLPDAVRGDTVLVGAPLLTTLDREDLRAVLVSAIAGGHGHAPGGLEAPSTSLVCLVADAWHDFLDTFVDPLPDSGERPSPLFEGFGAYCRSGPAAAALGPEDHSAAGLLADPAGSFERLETTLFEPGLTPTPWEVLVPLAATALVADRAAVLGHALARGGHASTVGGLLHSLRLGALPDLLAPLARDAASRSSLTAMAVVLGGGLLAHALLSAGHAAMRLSWEDAWTLVDDDGEVLTPWEPLSEAVLDPQRTDHLRDWLTRRGVDVA